MEQGGAILNLGFDIVRRTVGNQSRSRALVDDILLEVRQIPTVSTQQAHVHLEP